MYPFKTKPFQHQLDCFERSKDKKFYALLLEMGCGKSKVLLDTAAYMFDCGHINAVMIFANKGSYMNWITNEIPVHFVDHIQKKVFAWKANLGVNGERELKTFAGQGFDGLKIFVANVEALAYLRSYNILFNFCKAHRTLVIIDESSTIRNSQAKRTQSAILLGMKAVATRISTGSLIDNSPLNAYSQFEFLKHGCLGFTSFYSFRSHFAELCEVRMGAKKFKKITGFKNLEDLRRRLSQHSFIIKKEDCLDLPAKVYQTYNVDLTEEQVAAYKAMKQRCMAEINGELVSAKIVLTKLLRLHQIVCGSTKLDSGETVEIKSNRIQALMDILEETSRQVIIWATYRHDIFAIKKSLDLEYGPEATLTYFGDSTDDEKQKAKRVFYRGNDTEGVRFLVSNPVTGGFGNNFTGCTTHIYFSNDYNAEVRNQSEDRSHRIGQTERVTYIDIVCPGTVDEKILAALKKKKSLSDEITQQNWTEYI